MRDVQPTMDAVELARMLAVHGVVGVVEQAHRREMAFSAHPVIHRRSFVLNFASRADAKAFMRMKNGTFLPGLDLPLKLSWWSPTWSIGLPGYSKPTAVPEKTGLGRISASTWLTWRERSLRGTCCVCSSPYSKLSRLFRYELHTYMKVTSCVSPMRLQICQGDRSSARYAFVKFTSEAERDAAITNFNGSDMIKTKLCRQFVTKIFRSGSVRASDCPV